MALRLACSGIPREHGPQNLETCLHPVRSQFGPELIFVRYLAASAEQLASANAHHGFPESLVPPSRTEVERGFGKTCPVIFRGDQNRKDRRAHSGPRLRVEDGPGGSRRGQSPGEIALHAWGTEDKGLELRCEYSPQVYAVEPSGGG